MKKLDLSQMFQCLEFLFSYKYFWKESSGRHFFIRTPTPQIFLPTLPKKDSDARRLACDHYALEFNE